MEIGHEILKQVQDDNGLHQNGKPMKKKILKLRNELLRIGRIIIPKPVFEFFQPAYHFLLAFAGALIYRFPSRNMIVIGVTGTKGKTTTCNLIAHMLQAAGRKTGMTTTVNFRIGEKVWMNEAKQTMLGRFQLQKLLRQMADAGCEYAVVETSSEGIAQFRHTFVDYDVAVFLNLSPEHLDRHKGFENYRDAKLKLFKKLLRKKKGIGIYNLDDKHVNHFLDVPQYMQYGYTLSHELAHHYARLRRIVEIKNIRLSGNGSEFDVKDIHFTLPLIGEFNVQNAGAAICVGQSQDIGMDVIQKALASFTGVPGRMEIVPNDKGIAVVVDYAHEPKSLEAIYKAVIDAKLKQESGKLVCVFGATGGGRDKWKRPVMGRVAAAYCDEIVLTNDDPYDEDPTAIIEGIRKGIDESVGFKGNVHAIVDRREAIRKAISLAQLGDAVVLTGKGGETVMVVVNEKRIPWDERKIVEDELRNKKPYT
jgi:UDP-N-acetylmuramoyl-L-alanyl-D-glutamate--2,6-diaminopimelate ligase